MSNDNPFLKKKTLSRNTWVYCGLGASLLVFATITFLSQEKVEVPEQKPFVPYITKDLPYAPVDGEETGVPKGNILEKEPDPYSVTIRSLTTATGSDGEGVLLVTGAEVLNKENKNHHVYSLKNLVCSAPCSVKISDLRVSAEKEEEIWAALDQYLKIFPAGKSCSYKTSCTYDLTKE